MRLCDLVASVDVQRQHANLSSAIRLFVLDQLRGPFDPTVTPDVAHEPAPLPFPSDIQHDSLAALGDVPVTPYRDAIAATAQIYRRLAAEGRFVGAQHGVPAASPAATPAAATPAAPSSV